MKNNGINISTHADDLLSWPQILPDSERSKALVVICKRFGCGKRLTLQEQLCGPLCERCQPTLKRCNLCELKVVKFKQVNV